MPHWSWRFQLVTVPEPTVAQAIMILRGLRDTFEAHHKVSISGGRDHRGRPSCPTATSRRRFLPDKAIDLLDQRGRAREAGRLRPGRWPCRSWESELHQLRREQDYVAAQQYVTSSPSQRIEVGGGRAQLVEDWERG